MPDANRAEPRESAAPAGDVSYTPRGSSRGTSTRATLKGVLTEYKDDNLSDWAAALTYYGLLSLFPALIAVVALVGLFGSPAGTTQTVTEIVTKLGPHSAAETFAGPIRSVTAHRTTAGVLFAVGIIGAVYAASNYVGAFSRAGNVIFETPEGRPFWKLRPQQMLITLVMLVLVVAVSLALVLTGSVVNAVAGPLGVTAAAVSVWNIAKWPVILLVVIGIFTVLFYASPNARQRGVRWVIPGAAVSLALWLVASVLFALYASNFGSYDKTYGTLGGIVVFLVWIWITNLSLLLGMEINAERERNLEIRERVPGARVSLQMPPRGEPKAPETA